MFVLNPQYAYLVFCVGFLVVWVFIYTYSPMTRHEQLQMSLISIPGGPLSELLYLRDYWHPMSAFPVKIGPVHTVIEDMLFAFAFSGIVAVLYQLFTRRSLESDSAVRSGVRVACASAAIVSLFLVWLGINSIYATSAGFFVGALWMVSRRPDLRRPAILSGILVSLGYLGCLVVFYGLVANIDELSQSFWKLHDTNLDIRLVGIPITELIWAFSFGSLFGPLYAFGRHKRYV
ncbi:MAG: lycopene cyclase domain-containing protein [Candidatus Moraniibacteriota bacterium]